MRRVTEHATTYFQINAIGICAALAMSLFGANSASAEGLKGEEIKALLIGNTLEFDFIRNNDRGTELTIHGFTFYKDESTRNVKFQVEFQKGNGDYVTRNRNYIGKWRVAEDGMICGTNRKGQEQCRKNVRVSGDTVKMDGINDSGDRVYKLHKGNPKGL